MAGFTVLFFCIVQYLYVAYGARLPDVQGSKLEAESINSRNPKLLFGVSVWVTHIYNCIVYIIIIIIIVILIK